MNLSKILRFNYLMEQLLAKQLKNDDVEYLALKKQWNDEYKEESSKN